MEIAYSKHGVPIRLSPNRWMHIMEHHDDLAGYRADVLGAIENPDVVTKGKTGELIALTSKGTQTLAVVYRELSARDGFIITAFFTTQPDRIRKRGLVWPQQ